MSEDMSIADLVKTVDPKHQLRVRFYGTPEEVARVEEQIADFVGTVVRNLREMPDFYQKLNTVVRELAKNAAHVTGPAVMQCFVGDKGAAVTYTDSGGFYGRSKTAELFEVRRSLRGMYPEIPETGVDRIRAASDMVAFDPQRQMACFVKAGALNVVVPEPCKAADYCAI